MNILILEDDQERQRIFGRSLIGTNTVIVETAKEAIFALSTHDWDYLFLDHDLGGLQMCASGPDTGYEVAEWLAEHADRQPPNIIIHSFNPDGARKMHEALPNSVLAPGCWVDISLS